MSWPVSAAFTAAIGDSHRLATRCEVTTSAGAILDTLEILDGSVTIEAGASIRRRCEVTLTDPTGALTPALGSSSSLIAPFGNELVLYRGVTFTDATTELVPLGVFGISTVTAEDTPGGYLLKIVGYDRAMRVARALLSDSYTIAAGTDYATAIQTLITSRVSGLTFQLAPTTATTPLIVLDAGADAWKVAHDMAAAIGHSLYFDQAGVCVLEPVPDPATAPIAATYADGSTVLSLSRDTSNETTPNHIIVTGEATGLSTPVRGEAEDTDTSSPTYVSGNYGRVVEFVQSPLVTTNDQAADAANARLRASQGLAEQVTLDIIPNPSLDVGDVIQITRPRSGLNGERWTIQSLRIPLGVDQPMNLTARKRGA
jgi:hypothetical protein